MRSPDAALIRARAKAPLPSLLALHLSSSDIECIKHLELCRNLQSLYADNNHIKDLEGITELRKLWRIDLSGNVLRNINALASFRALGFLNLERNCISFRDLVCLRDLHLLDLRLLGNPALAKDNSIEEYRKKVVALLPNTWTLDGHFVSSWERDLAVEELDPFVSSLLDEPRQSAGRSGKFGSVTDVWVESEIAREDGTEHSNSFNLIQIASKPPRPDDPTDLRRLRVIVSFQNAECDIHNAHRHFTPSKHSPNAQLMPRIWLDDIIALPRHVRLEVMILLATFLEFSYPKVLLTEALTIRLLDTPNFTSEAIHDTANLPPYALVALIAITRQHSIQEEDLWRRTLQPIVASPEFADDSELLGAIPLFTTLLGTKGVLSNNTVVSEAEATAKRCERAIKLLSNAASFPDPEIVSCNGKGKAAAILRELMPLLRVAESTPTSPATQGSHDVVVPCFVITSRKTAELYSMPLNNTGWKRNTTTQKQTKPQDQSFDASLDEEGAEASSFSTEFANFEPSGSFTRAKPKPGHWVEVSPKQFVRIQFLSSDGAFVVGAAPNDSSRTITMSLEQMTRISNNVWRLSHLTQRQREGLSPHNPASDALSTLAARAGKLHRDSEAFHRHGAARNQGFPNHFVTSQMLQGAQVSDAASPAKAVEIFSSNDTLDANYVLAPPQLITVQNHCAVSKFQQCSGLWSPVRQPAPYSTLQSTSKAPLMTSSIKLLRPRQQPQIATPDDWEEIRRELQLQLGIDSPRAQSAGNCNVAIASLATAEPASIVEMPMQTRKERPTRRRRERDWHQVPTKTQFVVAPAAATLSASASAPSLPLKQVRMATVVLPALLR